MTDHHGAVGAPVPAVPVTETDMVLGRRGLTEFKPVAQEVGGTGEARSTRRAAHKLVAASQGRTRLGRLRRSWRSTEGTVSTRRAYRAVRQNSSAFAAQPSV